MSKESLVFALGFLVFVTPFLGVPGDWKETALIGFGLLLMFLGYLLRRAAFLRSLDAGTGERRGDAFVESVGTEERVSDTVQAKHEA